jgi:transposase
VAKIQKVYTKEFKEEAVKLAQNSGKSTAQIARELGVSDSAIYNGRNSLSRRGRTRSQEVGIKAR